MTPPPSPSDADMVLANWRIVWYIIALIGAALFTGALFLTKFIKKNLPIFKNFQLMVEDYTGEAARPGYDARPGMPERLQEIEKSQKTQSESLERLESTQHAQGEQLESVHHEVNFNHGGSVKDAAVETKKTVDILTDKVHDISSELGAIKDILAVKARGILSIEATVNHTTATSSDHPILEER